MFSSVSPRAFCSPRSENIRHSDAGSVVECVCPTINSGVEARHSAGASGLA